MCQCRTPQIQRTRAGPERWASEGLRQSLKRYSTRGHGGGGTCRRLSARFERRSEHRLSQDRLRRCRHRQAAWRSSCAATTESRSEGGGGGRIRTHRAHPGFFAEARREKLSGTRRRLAGTHPLRRDLLTRGAKEPADCSGSQFAGGQPDLRGHPHLRARRLSKALTATWCVQRSGPRGRARLPCDQKIQAGSTRAAARRSGGSVASTRPLSLNVSSIHASRDDHSREKT
jgi:hypothetical protein